MCAVCHNNIIIASVFRRTRQLLKLKSVSAYIPSASKGWPIIVLAYSLISGYGVHGNTNGADLRKSGTTKANIKFCAFNFLHHNNTKVM